MRESFVADIYPRLGRFFGWIVDGCLAAILFLVPLVVSSWSIDPIDAPKQTVLISLVLITFVAWIAQSLCLQRVALNRSWTHLIAILAVIGYGVSSALSMDRYVSFVGRPGQIQWAFSTVCAFVILYLILSTSIRSVERMYRFFLAILASSACVGIVALLQFFGAHPIAFMGSFALNPSFTMVGTLNALAAYEALVAVISIGMLLYACRNGVCILWKRTVLGQYLGSVIVWIALLVSLACQIAINYWPAWIALIIGLVILTSIPLIRREPVKHQLQLVIPGMVLLVAVTLFLLPNLFRLNLSSEVTPSFQATADIARQELLAHPLFGSGPGTWVFDYSKYRSIAVNLSPYWTIRFEQGFSTVLTALTTIGIVGFMLWALYMLSLLLQTATRAVKSEMNDEWRAVVIALSGLITFSLLFCLTNVTLSGFLIGAVLCACAAGIMESREVVWDARRSVGRAAVLSFMGIVTVVSAASLLWLVIQHAMAEKQIAQAISAYASQRPVAEIIGPLELSMKLNPLSDLASRNLAQAYLMQASQLLNQPANTDRNTQVNAAIASAVSAAKTAIQLSPSNVENWASAASILQTLASASQGADEQAITMFTEALTREPNNPIFYTELGKIHLVRADGKQQLMQSKDEQVKKDAKAQMVAELDLAAQALNQATQAKPDYAAAHYAMALVYERQGRGKDAIQKLEQVLSLDSKNVGVGFELSILYYRDGQKDRSLNLFEQIIALEPAYSNARWYLAAIYEERGRYDDAIAQIKAITTTSEQDAKMVAERMKQLIQSRDQAKAPKVQALPEPIAEIIGQKK